MNGIKHRSADEMKDSGIEWIGKIPKEWSIKKFKHLGEAIIGLTYSPEDIDENGTLVLRSSNIQSNKIDYSDVVFVSKKIPLHLRTKVGDILICSRNGSRNLIGKNLLITQSESGMTFGAFMTIYRSHESKFLYHVFNSPVFENQSASFLTTTINQLTTGNLNNFKFAFPNYEDKHKIANFLDIKTAQFDSIIAKKEQLIAKLEEAKKSLISEVVTGKVKIVDGQLVPRPPEEMKDSGVEWLGMVPGNWIVGGLTKYIGPIIDYRGKTPEKVDDGVFLVTAKNIKGGKIDYTLSEEYVRSDQYKLIMQRGAPIIGDVLFTTEAPLGEVANIDRTDIALAQRIIKFRGIECLLDNYFLRYFIMGECFQNQIQSRATGSTALGIKASKLPELKILIPTIVEQNEICRFLNKKIEYISNCIEKYIQQVTLLKSAKQSLISEAVTGKIDLRDWEIIEQGGAS